MADHDDIGSERIRGIQRVLEEQGIRVDRLDEAVDKLKVGQRDLVEADKLMAQEISLGFSSLGEKIDAAVGTEQEKREAAKDSQLARSDMWIKLLGGILTAIVTALGAYFIWQAKVG